MNKGFVVLAQNTTEVDYVECAEVLAHSVKKSMPNANITLITNDISSSTIFDNVIPLPYGDLAPDSNWKLINDWQVYDASPYEHTIKLEADMYIPSNIDYYWDVLQHRDLVVSTDIRNFRLDIVKDTYYRQFIISNDLPNCYNALTYFRKSELAKQFFGMVKDIFENWETYKKILKCKITEEVSTDWAYAIACHILGKDKTTMPDYTKFSMVHMKQMVNDTDTSDWTDSLVYEFTENGFRVNTFLQTYPFHYHIKHFSKKIKEYDRIS
jgi:hypothetical protein